MKLKYTLGLLICLLLTLSVLFYVKKDDSLKIITCPAIHSYFQTSSTETFDIEVLTNDPDDYHFVTDYLSSVTIQSKDESELIPLTITEISSDEGVYIYKGNPYYHIHFQVKIAFDSPDYEIVISEAYLNLSYANNETVKLNIGEFYYRFYNQYSSEVLVGSIQTTVMKLSEISSVSGIALELTNNASENIVINSITLGSEMVTANNFYLTEIMTLPTLFQTPSEILDLISFDYLAVTDDYQKNYVLRQYDTNIVYIPFQYNSSRIWLQRFYLTVNYEISGETKIMIVDDFPYIQTALFQQDRESEFISYAIHD